MVEKVQKINHGGGQWLVDGRSGFNWQQQWPMVMGEMAMASQ